MSSKQKKYQYWVKILIGMSMVASTIIFMNYVGNSRQTSFQETMKNSLAVAKREGDISNYKVEKKEQGFFKCKYQLKANNQN